MYDTPGLKSLKLTLSIAVSIGSKYFTHFSSNFKRWGIFIFDHNKFKFWDWSDNKESLNFRSYFLKIKWYFLYQTIKGHNRFRKLRKLYQINFFFRFWTNVVTGTAFTILPQCLIYLQLSGLNAIIENIMHIILKSSAWIQYRNIHHE